MKWKYHILGSHTHVQVYFNGAWNGKLCFTNEEFLYLKELLFSKIVFEAQ